MRSIWCLAGFFAVAACALPMADSQSDATGKRFDPPPAGQGSIYIYRESRSNLDRTSRFRVLLESGTGETRKLGILDDDTWFALTLPAGAYTVRCEGGDSGHFSTADARLTSGRTVFVQIYATTGRWVPNCLAAAMPETAGRAGVVRGKRVQELPPGTQ